MLARLTMVSSLALFAAAAPAEDWNQWRGPYRDGALADSPPLIDELPTEGLSPVWVTESEVPTGGKGGWSSPVVADGRVFVFAHLKNRRQDVELPPEKYPRLDEEAGAQLTSEERDEYERNRRLEQQRRRELEFQYLERLVCFDAQTGRQLWANERESRLTRFPQSASPAVVDGVVYVHGARGMVWAVSAETGGDLWRLQLPGEFDDEPHPASVAVADGVVIVLAGRLFGVDAARGQLLWQGEEEIRSDHASPALWWHDGAAHVVAHAGRETLCLSAKDGRERWRVESLVGRSSPVVVGDQVVELSEPLDYAGRYALEVQDILLWEGDTRLVSLMTDEQHLYRGFEMLETSSASAFIGRWRARPSTARAGDPRDR